MIRRHLLVLPFLAQELRENLLQLTRRGQLELGDVQTQRRVGHHQSPWLLPAVHFRSECISIGTRGNASRFKQYRICALYIRFGST